MDNTHNQVRLAMLNATDVATVPGQFVGVVGDRAIVVNGLDLLAVSPAGAVTKLGQLAGHVEWSGVGSVAVNPSLSQWLYTVVDLSNLISQIHLGAPTGDKVIATAPSPDGNTFYQPFAWNASGAYMVKEGTGLGGVGPFLEYHFPLVRINLSTGQITEVSPACVAEMVLDDGTFLCRNLTTGLQTGGLEVRSPSGSDHVIQISTGSSGGQGVYSRLTVTADQRHVVAARNGSSDPALINYQMVAADLSASGVTVFGVSDFLPDTWLPDGRLIADHLCWTFQENGGPCDQSLDGTYIVSADGHTRTLFYKLAPGSSVVASV
jgi:hypothetical protein